MAATPPAVTSRRKQGESEQERPNVPYSRRRVDDLRPASDHDFRDGLLRRRGNGMSLSGNAVVPGKRAGHKGGWRRGESSGRGEEASLCGRLRDAVPLGDLRRKRILKLNLEKGDVRRC